MDTAKTPASKPVDDPVAKIKALVQSLQDRYNDAKLDDSEGGRSARAAVAGQLRRLTHDQIHPDEDYIQVDVPPSVTGEPFKINDTDYSGLVVVPACVASTLLYMIDQNRKVDIDRMRESGRTLDLGSIIQRARVIQDER